MLKDELVGHFVVNHAGRHGRRQRENQNTHCHGRGGPHFQRFGQREQAGNDPGQQHEHQQRHVLRFIVIKRLFDLEIDQGQQCHAAHHQIEQAVQADGTGFGLLDTGNQRVAQQQGQRQHARHDVSRQLAFAQAEQGQRQQQPHQQEHHAGMTLVLPGILEGCRQQGYPGQAGDHHQRQIEPPWTTVLGIFTGKAANVLVPEEKIPVIGLLGVNRKDPRQ